MGASSTAATGRLHVSQLCTRPCKTVPDGARQCQAVPERADKQSAQTHFDAFQCTCPGGHLQQRARSGRLFRMGAGKTDEHPAGCGTAKARRPGVPDGSILPTLIYPGTLAYPHVSASSAFLPTLLRRSHEATVRVPPWPASHSLCPPTACCLSRSRKLPLPASART